MWPFPATLSFLASPADHAPDAARRADARLSGPSTEGPETRCRPRPPSRSPEPCSPYRAPRWPPPHRTPGPPARTRSAPPAASPSTPTTRPASCARTCASPAAPHGSAIASCAGATPAASAMIPSASSACGTDACTAGSPGWSGAPTPPRPPPPLEAIAACESGGNPRRTPATGSTASTSSRRRPGRASAAPATRPPASEAEQDRRAAQLLYAREGGQPPWPVCGALARPLSLARAMDPAALRAEFPVLERVAYLNAGHGRAGAARRRSARPRGELAAELARRALDAALRAPHRAAGRAARRATRGCSAARVDDVALDDLDERGARRACSPGMDLGPGDEIVTSDQEHPGADRAADRRPRARRDDPRGARSPTSPTPSAARRPLVALLARELDRAARSRPPALAEVDVPVILDGAQGAGAIPVDVAKLGCAAYAAAGPEVAVRRRRHRAALRRPGLPRAGAVDRARATSASRTRARASSPLLKPDARRYDTPSLARESIAFSARVARRAAGGRPGRRAGARPRAGRDAGRAARRPRPHGGAARRTPRSSPSRTTTRRPRATACRGRRDRPRPAGHPARARLGRRVERARTTSSACSPRSSGAAAVTTSMPALLAQHAMRVARAAARVRRKALVLLAAERDLDRAEQVLELLEACAARRSARSPRRSPSSHASATCEIVAPLVSAIAARRVDGRKLRSIARRAGASSRSSPASAIREPSGGGSSRE